MKKLRRGFTLVELLIVVAILAILSATMMVSMSGVTAKAKASSIAANLDACRTAAILYYAKHGDESDFSTKTTEDALKAELAMWEKMKGAKDTDTIYYTAGEITTAGTDGTTPQAPDNWAVEVDFSGDPEAAEIVKQLQNIKGYSTAFVGGGIFDFLFGVKPAFADETKKVDNSTLYMILITGEIKYGSISGGEEAKKTE